MEHGTDRAPTAYAAAADVWPITREDAERARGRIEPYLSPTPLRHYPELDAALGGGLRVLVKHENHQPTNSFKIRNALSAVTALEPSVRARGVCAATRGNYGLGLAYVGRLLDVPIVVCVPHGNNPEKNSGMRALGAEVVERGEDYDASVIVAEQLAAERGLTIVHSTNDRDVLAGATTLWLEVLEQAPDVDAAVVAVGGGSQAVGALLAFRARPPVAPVYGVQAAAAPAGQLSWKAGRIVTTPSANTFADGLATRTAYEMTFPALHAGLADFVTVTEAEIAEAMRLVLRTTHNLVEGAGAVGLAGLGRLRDTLAGRSVAIVLSGGNVDRETLRRVVAGEL